jgi:hypothetical protein
MFERYTDDARRALFYARAAVSEHGGTSIGAVPLLLGVLRVLPGSAASPFGGAGAVQALSECLVASMVSQDLSPESEEIPFDSMAKRILQGAGRRPSVASAPDGQDIDSGDLLLALLREDPVDVLPCLQRAGLDVTALKRQLADERGW